MIDQILHTGFSFHILYLGIVPNEVNCSHFNPLKPEFTIVRVIVIVIVAILDLQWMKMIWCGVTIKEKYHVLVNQFHGNFHSKNLSCGKIRSFFKDVIVDLLHREDSKG